ncbi:allantoinase [Meiothermus sp. QL-1]|uniref:allantoinase n=1 Tax=Meiothermus sp. QL-1 TaxID=2058095 RepID=UPI000E0BEACF|nr:allantoinase [Meiothermus sp. QL-1]RDI95448.1 allantoinase [Meiothermus sp. QL-1]
MLDLIVRGGTLVTPQGLRRAELGVLDGKIVRIEPEIAEKSRRELSATGLYLFPGLIDVHVHFNEPGRAHWEGIASGSAALARGGGTLFFDMPLNSLPCTLDGPSFDQKLSAMRASACTDFALWGGLTPKNLDRLEELAGRGVIGFKAFMCDSGLPEFPPCDDGSLYEGMRIAARLGLVVAVHAESEGLTAHLTRRMRERGRGWREYAASRPVLSELEAIQRALLLAQETGCKLHIVHISSGTGVALAAEARARGVDVSLETCPHYLAFTEEDLERLGAVGKCAPPLRSGSEQDRLWQEVLGGSVDIIASDHSPSPPELKQGPDFFAAWGGIAGVQSTLAVMLTQGWQQRGLALERVAALLAQNPARRFGLRDKGGLEPGKDADFTLVDLGQEHTLAPEELAYRHPISPYLGRRFRGVVRGTWLRGEPVFLEGKITRPSEVRLQTP